MVYWAGLPLAVMGWAASCGDGPGYFFLSKGVGAGPTVTQLGPVTNLCLVCQE